MDDNSTESTLLKQLWAQHDEVARSGTAPLLRDLELAGRLVDFALVITDAGLRIGAVAHAAHAIDAVLEDVASLHLPEPLRGTVEQVAGRLQGKLTQAE